MRRIKTGNKRRKTKEWCRRQSFRYVAYVNGKLTLSIKPFVFTGNVTEVTCKTVGPHDT